MTRIIAGAAGSLRLGVPKSGTRPTSDRVREAIFSTLDAWGFTSGHRVLDLYAGSGALGLEAVSRGAGELVLVERHAQAAQTIERNIALVKQALRGAETPSMRVVRGSVQTFLEAATPAATFDVVFLDPPYELGDATLTANLTTLLPLLAPDAVVMVERGSRNSPPEWPAGLEQIKEKKYGDTQLWWAEVAVQ